MGNVVASLSSFGMAVGPPLVYVDQFVNIIRKRDSTGFSRDVCGVLIFAKLRSSDLAYTRQRVYFWLSRRFEIALLVQSILLIISQLALLHVVVRYAYREDDAGPPQEGEPTTKPAAQRLLATLQDRPVMKRPLHFWQWEEYSIYLQAVAGYIFVLGVIYLFLHGFGIFVDILGFFALGLESTLPIPQLITNWRRKSLAGFRLTVLLGWVGGDAFKTIYFFLRSDNALQFRVCAIFQLSIDCLIVAQAWLYRHNTRLEKLALSEEEEEQAFQASQAGAGRRSEGEEEPLRP